jgi:hypothetical protein
MGLRSSVRARMAPSSALGPNWTRLVLQLSNGSTRATMQPSCFEPISRPRAFDLRESARSDAGFSSHESPLEDRRSNRPDANCGDVPLRRSSARPAISAVERETLGRAQTRLAGRSGRKTNRRRAEATLSAKPRRICLFSSLFTCSEDLSSQARRITRGADWDARNRNRRFHTLAQWIA